MNWQRADTDGEADDVSLRFYAKLPVRLPIHRDETSLDARTIELDAVQSSTPLAMALIIQSVVFDLQTSSQITGTEDSHGDRQILPMTTCTRRDIFSAVISAVSTRRCVPCSFNRFHLFATDTQEPEKNNRNFRKIHSVEFLLKNTSVKYVLDYIELEQKFIAPRTSKNSRNSNLIKSKTKFKKRF